MNFSSVNYRVHVLCMLGLLVLLAVCPVLSAADDATEVVILQGVNITSLDPHQESSLVARQVYLHLYNTLITLGPNNELLPGLAESWEYIDDLTLEFRLQENVVFHNGEPFNAAAVKYSLQRIADPTLKGVWGGSVAHVKEIEIIDDYTVRVISETPYAPGLIEVGRMFMIPPAYMQQYGYDHFNLHPVGTGAFKFVEQLSDGTIILEANDDYFGGRPSIDRLRFRAVPETLARVVELITGNADIITNVPPELAQMIDDSGVATAKSVASARNAHVYLDPHTPPLDDIRVRQALNYAIDVPELIDTIYAGNASPTPGPLGHFTFGWNPEITGYSYDKQKALDLLAAAGYPDGFEITFHYGPGRFVKDGELAEAIVGQLSRVGITCNMDRQEWGNYWGNYVQGKLDSMFLLSMGTTGGPDVQLKWFHQPRFGHYFSTPELNAMLDEMLTTVDATARLAVLDEIQEYIIEQAAYIFLFDIGETTGVSNRLNWDPWPNSRIMLHDTKVNE